MQLWQRQTLKDIILTTTTGLFIVMQTAQAANRYVFIHSDMLGTPMATTDENGNIISRENVTPYGDSLGKRDSTNSVVVGSPEHGPGYTGHVRDRDLGLTYMQARYYDPVIGRFMGVDPVGVLYNEDPAYFNRYAYAGNNPYRHVDPDGKQYYPGLANAIKYKIANTIYDEVPSRDSVQAGLQTVSGGATIVTVAATVAMQPEIAVPAGAVATASGYLAAALDEAPGKAIATEAAAQITGAKAAKTIGSLAIEPFKRGTKSSSDNSMTDNIFSSSSSSGEGWSFEQRLESLGATGIEQGFKHFSEDESLEEQNSSTIPDPE